MKPQLHDATPATNANRVEIRGSLSFFRLAQLRDNGKVFKGGGIALDFAAGRQLPQQAAHDFAAAGLGQRLGEADVIGTGQ